MMSRFRPVAPVLLGVWFAQLALGALNPLISVLLAGHGVATLLIGFVASAYYIGFLFGSLTAPRVVHRVGHIRAFAVFSAIAADCALAHATTDSPIAWGLLRAVTGYAMAGVFLIAESWLNAKVDATSRGRIFASYLLVSWGASAVGPQALNVAHPFESFLFILVAMGFVTALVPMALTEIHNPEISDRTHFGIARLFAISPLGLVACFAAGLVNSAFYGLVPVYGQAMGLGAASLSLLLTTALVGALATQYPIGMVADRFGRRPVMLAALVISCLVVLAIMIFGAHSFTALLVLAFVYAGMTGPLYGLGVGQTNDYISPKEFVGASGGLLFTWALGASAGPAAASAVMGAVGPVGLFVYILAVLGSIAGFTVFRMRRRTGLPIDQQSGFVPAPQTPPRIAELDPRAAVAADDLTSADARS